MISLLVHPYHVLLHHLFDSQTGENIVDLSLHTILLKTGKKEHQKFGDEGWNIGESVFGEIKKIRMKSNTKLSKFSIKHLM